MPNVAIVGANLSGHGLPRGFNAKEMRDHLDQKLRQLNPKEEQSRRENSSGYRKKMNRLHRH